MVLQRFPPRQPFARWGREVLLAIAGQASAAIQNARLYKMTDRALAQRVRQLQALLNSTSEGVLMFNTDGEVVLVNPTAARLLNRPRHRLQGQALDPAQAAAPLGYDPEELEQLLRDVRRLQRPDSRRTVYRVRARREENGEESRRRFLERNEAPVLSADDELLGWLIVLRDVTEQEERNEWRTSVTRMIVHDLRNPVATLISDLDLMENAVESGDVEKMRGHVQQARRGCHDMLDMIDSLMDMTRLEAGQMILDEEAIRLPPLAEKVLERLQPLAQKKEIALSLEVDPQLPAVWADADMMRRVFVNLLDNAMKFTPSGGSVGVTLSKEVAFPQHEAGARCTVTDTGPGIPQAYRERIFERFTRVNVGGGQVRGTGLGLAFCRLAVEAHGGNIWVQDGPEGGSRFTFTVPGVPLFDTVSALHSPSTEDERHRSP
jgi:PAS domain S-box-containing protein